MGAMKNYLMWLEEKGYMELVYDLRSGHEDYQPTSKHPGETEAMNEYLTRQDAQKETDNA